MLGKGRRNREGWDGGGQQGAVRGGVNGDGGGGCGVT